MKAAFAIESFPLLGSALHVSPTGKASLLQGDAIKAHLRRLPEGHVLGAFPVSSPDDVHSETWEVHPAGDEILVALAGEVDLEYLDESRRDTTSLTPGQGLVVPRGVWHRLVLREPGLLLVLSPPHGTRLSQDPLSDCERSESQAMPTPAMPVESKMKGTTS